MDLLLLLHVLGAILFVGNIIMAAFWKVGADRTGELAVIAKAARGLMRADYCFTIPGIVLLLASGHAMAHRLGYPLPELSWLGVSYLLFALSGLIWAAALLPLQRRMIREADISVREGRLTAGYRSASARWNAFGTVATLLPLAVLALMVLKRLPF